MRDKHDQILDAAEREFLEHGYEATSIDAIVEEAGGSKSTVYAHFGDKTRLFSETLARVRQELDFTLPHSADVSVHDPREALTVVGIEFLTTLYSVRALHLFRTVIAESARFPEVARQLMDEGYSVAVDRMEDLLAAIAAGGSAPVEDPAVSARRFVAFLTGETHLRLLMGIADPPGPEEITSIAARAAADVLHTPAGPA
jgi:AcrR family transcriptional regulator